MKACELTRGGLTDKPPEWISKRQPARQRAAELPEVSRGHSIPVLTGEGLNIRGLGNLKDSQGKR